MEFFAKSLVSWICLVNGSMSGASRAFDENAGVEAAGLRVRDAFLHHVQQLGQCFPEHVMAHRVHRNLHEDFPF